MYGRYDGWHKVHEQLVYVEDGLAVKKYDIGDEKMTITPIDKPCTLNTYKARMWHKKRREKAAAEK